MTVEHVNTIPGRVVCFDLDDFVFAEPDHVFETGCFVGFYTTTSTGDYPEVDQVHVNLSMLMSAKIVLSTGLWTRSRTYRMCPSTRRVLQLPNLNFAPGNVGEDAVLYVGKPNIVDEPLAV
jgi:hypothetical protein